MFDAESFSNNLKNIVNSYESISDFAIKADVGRSYISKYINKKIPSPPTPKVLMKIANASHGIAKYEELMEVCGYLISPPNSNLNEIRDAEKVLEYANLIKKLSLNNKEIQLINKINQKFDEYIKNSSIDESEKKSLELLNELDISGCNLDKIKKATKYYIMSQAAKVVINKIYSNTVKIDTQYNYFEYLDKLNTLSKDSFILPKDINYIPIIGKVAAGQPILAEQYIEGYLPVDPNIYGLSTSDNLFYLRVSGQSMNMKIKNGDYALIHKQDYAEDGDIVVAIVNGDDEATLKRYKRLNNQFILLEPMSTDPTIESITVDLKDTNFKIIGKAIGQFGKF